MNSSDGEALPAFYGDVISLQVSVLRRRSAISNHILIIALNCQRVYQEISKGSGNLSGQPVAPASLASVPFGPGSLPLQQEETEDGQKRNRVLMSSNRISSEEKTYLEAIQYKGEELAPGAQSC